MFVFWVGTNGFLLKTMNERFTAAGLRCRHNLVYKNFTLSFDRLRQKLHQKACRTCSTIIFTPSSVKSLICGVFAVPVVAPAYGVCAYACVTSEKCAFEIDHINVINDCKIQEIQAFLLKLLRTLMMYELKK